MFDSHCHLDAKKYDIDRGDVLARARAAGVRGIFVPGIEPAQWQTLPAFCAQDGSLCFGLGLHPWYVHSLAPLELTQALAALNTLARTPGCVAVGECGLDAPRAKLGAAPMALQRRVLEAQLAVAYDLRLPLVLHCVGAHGALLELLEAHGPVPGRGVMHSYSGSVEFIPRYARLGLSFSFAGIVAREQAQRPRRALQAVPCERLLVESDGPGHPTRHVVGSRSEPAHLRLVLEAAAKVRGKPYEQLAHQTSHNGFALFFQSQAKC